MFLSDKFWESWFFKKILLALFCNLMYNSILNVNY